MPAESGRLCPECQIGRLRPTTAFFFSESGGHVLSVPDFPAWTCDVCALRLYDQEALAELRAMLEMGRSARKQGRRKLQNGDESIQGGDAPNPRHRS